MSIKNEADWVEFIARLKSDNHGEGVSYHHTAHPIFEVQQKITVVGLDRDYTDDLVLIDDEGGFIDPDDYFEDQDDDEKTVIDCLAIDENGLLFSQLKKSKQLELLAEHNSALTITGSHEEWKHVTTHLTKAGAEAFIKRKAHDYGELRIYVESTFYSAEIRTVIEAMLSGQVDWIKEPERDWLSLKILIVIMVAIVFAHLAALVLFH